MTDIARYKNIENPKGVIQNWLRNRNTIEFLGIWELIHNPNFKGLEFEAFKKEADVLNMALFGMTAKEWRENNPNKKGNIRDYVSINELICLANLENTNSIFINEGMTQSERLYKLNQIAISQMKILTRDNKRKLLK